MVYAKICQRRKGKIVAAIYDSHYILGTIAWKNTMRWNKFMTSLFFSESTQTENGPEKHIENPQESKFGKELKFKMAAKIVTWVTWCTLCTMQMKNACT